MGSKKSKPKPRLALYGGIAVGVLNLGTTQGKVVDIIKNRDWKHGFGVVLNNVVSHPAEAAVNAGGPMLAGALISLGADKVGLNKVLAKAKAPVRA